MLYPTEDQGEEEMMGEGSPEEAHEDEEAREVRAPTIPITPSSAEVLQHRLKHHPYRD